MKIRELHVLLNLPKPQRQTVSVIERVDGTPIYGMSFEELEDMNVVEFIQHSKPIQDRFQQQSEDVLEAVWKDLETRSSKDGKCETKQPIYAINLRESFIEEDKKDGIQWTYANIGMLFTWFYIYCEGSDLCSVNFLLYGAPKYWIIIPKSQAEKLETFLKRDLKSNCACIIPPALLDKHGIRFTIVKQNPGELIIIAAGAFCFGFNCGFNACESSNIPSISHLIANGEPVIGSENCE